jgi:hypothetical protein
MKPLNEVKVIKESKRKLDHIQAIQLMLLQQIKVIEDIMERNNDLVKSPMAYNYSATLLEQLKLHSFAAFMEHSGCAPEIPDGMKTPLFVIDHGLV